MKKILKIFTLVLLLNACLFGKDTSVKAAEGMLVVPGASKQKATQIELDTLYLSTDGVNTPTSEEWYKFTTPNVSGNLIIKAEHTSFYCYSEDGEDMGYGWIPPNDLDYQLATCRLKPNTTYYICSKYNSDYQFELNYWLDVEPDTKEEAIIINSNTTYRGTLSLHEDVDVYKYTADQSGLHRIYFTGKNDPDEYYYYDMSAKLYYYASNRLIGETSNYDKQSSSFEVYLDKGETTYLVIEWAKGDYSIGIYNAKVSSIQLNATEKVLDINEKFLLQPTIAPTYALNKKVTYNSSNTKVATVDAYGNIKAVGPGKAVITCSAQDGGGARTSCNVVVKPGQAVVNKATTQPISTSSIKISWDKQTGVSGYYIYQKESTSKTYKLIKDVTGDSITSYTHSKLKTGKKYQYYIQAYVKDYKNRVYVGKNSSSIALQPLPAKVSNVKRSVKKGKNGSKAYTYSWSKVTGVSGYEVYVKQSSTSMTNSKWKKVNWKYNKTLTTNKSGYTLKKGDMKFKVRAYVKVNGKRYYGAFSKEI